jgi:2-C-methyl-D-erythritol 4-phosphate cytidylyltransferase
MDTSYSAIIYAVEEISAAWGGMLQEKLGGKAVLNHSLDIFEDDPHCAEMLVLADPRTREWISGNPLEFASAKMRVLSAADTRGLSLAQAAQAAQHKLLVLHDAQRPNFGAELLLRVLLTVKPGQGAVPATRAGHTLGLGVALAGAKQQAVDENLLGPKADHRMAQYAGTCATVQTYSIQTPQAYLRAEYLHAVERAQDGVAQYTDDTELLHADGLSIALVRGRWENLRLDGADELRILQKLMGAGPKKKEKYTGLGW